MNLKDKITVIHRIYFCKIKENLFLIECLLLNLLIVGYIYRILGNNKRVFQYFSQVHRSTRLTILRNIVEPWLKTSLSIHKNHRILTGSIPSLNTLLGSRVLVLKPCVSNSEKGVLMVMFSETLPVLPNIFKMEQLMRDYILVFEPSWSGYCTEDVLHYANYQQPVFLLGKHFQDYRFINQLNSNLVAVDMGASDWVDPNLAVPFLGSAKKYDIVMNANWGDWKRHHVLFAAISDLEKKVSVALVGFEWGNRNKADIEALAKYYGVYDQIEIFERIPFESVMEINCQSRIAILLSLKEGANRAIPEALFCDVPAIVLSNNIGGQVRNIVPETGILSTESKLGQDIMFILESPKQFSPRSWAMNNISCIKSTERLNYQLKESETNRGADWTKDITIRANSPDVTYYDQNTAEEYETYGKSLSKYLK